MRWPLVGREAQLDRVTAALTRRAGGGLAVHGPAGVGKSRLLAEARDRAGAAGVEVRWVLATAASQGLPFGAFAGLLPADLDPSQPGGVLAAVAADVRAPRRPVALAVDDAHLLDPGSAALLAHLASRACIPFVATVRDGAPTPDAVTALWKDLGVERLRLDALRAQEVAATLAAALDGPVASSLTDELARLSGGNPLLLRELVASGLRSGSLVRRDGLWIAGGPLLAVDDLPAAVTDRLDRLAPRLRAAAELVALAEPVGAALLESLLPPDVRAALDEERLLVGLPDRRRVQVRLVHPLFTEALRATVPPLRARDHANRLATALVATGLRRREDLLRCALWHLAAGRRDRPDLYLAASRDAAAVEDHELAVRLAEAAVDGGGGAAARRAHVRELGQVGRMPEALRGAEELAEAAVEPEELVKAGLLRATLHVRAGDLARAEQLLLDAEADAAAPELRARVLVKRLELAFTGGDLRRTAALADALARQPDREALVTGGHVAIRALASAGRAVDALRLSDRVLDAIDDGVGTTVAVRHATAMARCQALAYAGRVRDAAAEGSAGATAAHGAFRAAWLRDVGQALLHVGRPRSSLAALRESLTVLPGGGAGPTSALWSLDGLAEAAALVGDVEEAQRHVDELERRRPDRVVAPRSGGATWAAAAGGDLRRARDLARAAAAVQQQRGAGFHEATACYDLARLGRPAEVVDRLAALAGSCQGELVAAYAAAAAALADGDGAAAEAAAERLGGCGCDLLAAELWVRAAVAHRAAGHRSGELRASRSALALLRGCEGASTPLTAALGELGGLTEREWEVATLVASGLSDREVAERLTLSVRTVHTHLHRCYRKLGVSGREELAAALR